jgi:uncharacterized membrane protein
MKARLQQWLYRVHASYWFLPLLMAIGAIVLSQFVVELDRRVGADWMTDSWWASLNQPDGARSLLATVAGSMITVAGVTFSLTIVAVSYTTSHFGPRLLDNFMRDRGNQITLGTFVATFLFCLLVLRTVRSGSGNDSVLEIDGFVPHISVLVAIILTLASVGVLIFFIHHVPESINISTVLDDIANQISARVEVFYPDGVGEPTSTKADYLLSEFSSGEPVVNRKSGYLQGLDEDALIGFAKRNDVRVQLLVRPGDYVLAGQKIAIVLGGINASDSSSQSTTEACADGIHNAIAIGSSRTPTDDIYFLLNQYVEVAARALSPGVNDPFTAIQCLDQLSRAIVEVSHRNMPGRFRMDDEETVRIVTTESTWADFASKTFGRLVPYVRKDENVKAYMLDCIDRISSITPQSDLRDELARIARDLTSTNGTASA